MIGCQNKWSIAESPQGLYFIDNNTSSIYLFNGQIKSLSDSLGFKSWMEQNNSHEIWNPRDFNNFRTFYDYNNNDVYFTGKKECLTYSEKLNAFTSFMSYEYTRAMFNVGSDFYSINKGKLWKMFNGDYNSFFGETKPYNITYIVNPEEPYDKIFDTIDFRADVLDSFDQIPQTPICPIDIIEASNEYQKGLATSYKEDTQALNIRQKFRVWRAIIPRNNGTRDRIRNPWIYLKLGKNNPTNNKVELHDAIVHYYV